ncbi:hypothetical protein LJE72_23990 [Desulfosporosinus sp. SRJS8]|nr:hypothetical protein [Desulfosporosinus sp. SRJS8]
MSVQIDEVPFAEKPSVHHKPRVLNADLLASFHHSDQMRLVGDTAIVCAVIHRQFRRFSIIHAQVDLRELLFVPVIAKFYVFIKK